MIATIAKRKGYLLSLFLFLMMLSVSVFPAFAQTEVTITSLNSSLFPFIYSNVSVTSSGNSVTDLTKDDFQVFENNNLQTEYFEVTPPETGGGVRLADIVFLIDVSGSMGGEIADVRNNVNNFANALAASNIDFRLGLVRFGNSSGANPYLFNSGNLADDVSTFQGFVNTLYASGGYEPGFLAIRQAITGFNFRPGAQKVFLIITDEDSDDRNKQQTIDMLLANSITVHSAVDCNSGYSRSDYCDDTSIRGITGGLLFGVSSSYNTILDTIVETTSSTYVVRYKSSNPNFDGTLRNVEIFGTAYGETDSDTADYIPGATPEIKLTPDTEAFFSTPPVEGASLTISAVITDDVPPSVTSARLYYKMKNDSSFQSVNMTNSSGDLWEGEIPGTSVQYPGIEFYITATDSQAGSSLPKGDPSLHPFNVAVLPNELPIITHTPPTTLSSGQPVEIVADISDTTYSLQSVKLFYRKKGEIQYVEIGVSVGLASYEFRESIPGDVVTSDGVEYYIKATDDLELSSTVGTADIPLLLDPPDDTTPPIIAIGYPADGEVIFNEDEIPKLTVSGLAADEFGIAMVTVNGEIAAMASGVWSAEIPLWAGENKIEVIAVDNCSNQAVEAITVIYQPEFTFVHITDSHIGIDPKELLDPVSSYNESVLFFTDTLDRIRKLNPMPIFILLTGDIAEYDDENFYNSYNNLTRGYPIPIYPIPGNHDGRGLNLIPKFDYPGFKKVVNPLLESLVLRRCDDEIDYYFDRRGYRFIGLASGFDFIYDPWDPLCGNPITCLSWWMVHPEGTGLTDTQMDWLKNFEMESPKVIFMHHPAIAGDSHFDDGAPGGNDGTIIDNRKEFINYSVNNNAKLILTGHSHENVLFNSSGQLWEWVSPNDQPFFIQTESVKTGGGFRLIEVNKGGMFPHQASNSISELPKLFGVLKCPVDLHVYDSSNRHNGKNDLDDFDLEIPNSFYTNGYPPIENTEAQIELPELTVLYNINTDYVFKIKSFENGTFNFMIGLYDGMSVKAEFEEVEIMNNSTALVYYKPNQLNFIMEMDSNNDGVTDYLLTPEQIIVEGNNLYETTFLPPITTMDEFSLVDGSTLPIKFTAIESNTGEFINDDTVNVTITNSECDVIASFTYGTGTDNVRIDSTEKQYIVNFHTKDYALNLGETYAVCVTFGEMEGLKGYDLTYFTLLENGKAKRKGQ
ncbi:MAG: metallophosphoesterase [Deltaproteobacteria bacterium]|jgi:hypothetical protein|nr:metallophosphoesterase [Deltaproteobacteria bacterium]